MSADRDAPDDEAIDQRRMSTLQVRTLPKNPQIERKAALRSDTDTVAAPSQPAEPAGSVAPQGAPEPPPSSLYDRLEHSEADDELDAAFAQLEADLRPDAPRPAMDVADLALSPTSTGHPPEPPTAGQLPAVSKTVRPRRPRVSSVPEAEVDRSAAPTLKGPPPAAPDLIDRTRMPTEPLGRPADFEEDETVVSDRPVRSDPRARPSAPSVDAAAVAPVPRVHLFGGGTKGAGAELRKQKILREAEVPDVRTPALRLYAAALDEPQLHRLDASLAEAEAGDEAPMSSATALAHLLHDRAFGELALEDAASFLGVIADAESDPSTINAAFGITKAGVLTHLSAPDRLDVHKVFRRLDAEGRTRLARLAARTLRGKSALQNRDGHGASIGAHLVDLFARSAVDPAEPTSGLNIHAAAQRALGTAAQPVRVELESGLDGILGLLEYCMADVHPAELLRLWRALLGSDNAISMAGGRDVSVAAVRERAAPSALRGLLALLAVSFRTDARSQRPGYLLPGGHSIDADVVARVLEQLFGVRYVVAAGAPAAHRRLQNIDAHPQRCPPVLLSLLHERGERLFVYDHADEAHVYLRGPHGRSPKRAGDRRTEPVREVVAPNRGVDRIDIDAFQESAGVALVPATEADSG